LLPALAAPAAAGLAVTLAASAWAWRSAVAAAPASAAPESAATRRPLRLLEAGIVAALLLLVSAAVAWAQGQFGNAGLWAGTALAALADAHAPIAAAFALHQAGTLVAGDTLRAALLAVSVNTASRCVVGALSGGPRYAWRVARVLLVSAAAAWAVLLLR
jgi:uncharacterized membrane protein (DUF4010 family)